MQLWTILLAGGRSTRLGSQGAKKQFLLWKKRPLFWNCALTFAAIPSIHGIVFVFPPDEYQEHMAWVQKAIQLDALGLEYAFARGGQRRQDSVASGLQSLPKDCSHVLVHDAARPLVSPDLIQSVLTPLFQGALAAIPALPVTDTIKRRQGESVYSLPRHELYAAQTPQGFQRTVLLQAHEMDVPSGGEATDDASLVEGLGYRVDLVQGEEGNIKITTECDLQKLQEDDESSTICSGWGFDVHRYGGERSFKLGGVAIPEGPSVKAHSDGDAALHAIMDAILGCLGRGDIGDHFPDTDPRYEGTNSTVLLNEILSMALEDGLSLKHLDLTLICQHPKLGSWKRSIKQNLARLLNLDSGQINVKATTEEGLGFTGQGEGIKAVAQIVGIRTDKR